MKRKENFKFEPTHNGNALPLLLETLNNFEVAYCLIGGQAVNAYVDPVKSLDLDILVAANKLETIRAALPSHFMAENIGHSINLSPPDSELKIQLHADLRYQPFIEKSVVQNVLGYDMKVACLEDVFAGKCWAYLDETKRIHKKQKDLADIVRLIEPYPHLINILPDAILAKIDGSM